MVGPDMDDDSTSEVRAASLRMRRVREGGRAFLWLAGELDVASAERLTAELREIEAADPEEIIVDLSGLNFIDSIGLNALVEAYNRSRAGGPRLYLRRPQENIWRVFQITRMAKRLPFVE